MLGTLDMISKLVLRVSQFHEFDYPIIGEFDLPLWMVKVNRI